MRNEHEILEKIEKIQKALKEQDKYIAGVQKWHYREIVEYLYWVLGEDKENIF